MSVKNRAALDADNDLLRNETVSDSITPEKDFGHTQNILDSSTIGKVWWDSVTDSIKSVAGFFSMLFQTITTPTYQEGLMWYDGENFNLYDNIPGTSLQINKEFVVDFINDNGATLTNFTVVRYNNATSGYPTALRAQADTIANCRSVAVCTHDVAVGAKGKVTTLGVAGGNTSMWNNDDILYVSATVPGQLTNIEQPILSPVATVLVSATEENGGKILIRPQGIINPTALGQSSGNDRTQTITNTPQSITAFENNAFELNTTVTHTGTTNLTTTISPASIGASGYYTVSFSISIASNDSALFSFEIYKNSVASGILATIDLRNNNIDAGSCALSGLTQTAPLLNGDEMEIYCYNNGGTGDITYTAALFSIKREGNQ